MHFVEIMEQNIPVKVNKWSGKSVPQPPFNSILKTNQVPIQIVKGTWNFSTISNFSGRRTTSENSFQFDLSLNYRDFHSLESSYIMTLFNEQLCCGFWKLYVMTVLGFRASSKREHLLRSPVPITRAGRSPLGSNLTSTLLRCWKKAIAILSGCNRPCSSYVFVWEFLY